jgi:hypothetical protein
MASEAAYGLAADHDYLASTPNLGPDAAFWPREQVEEYFGDADRARAAFVRGYLAEEEARQLERAKQQPPRAKEAPTFFAEFLRASEEHHS